MAIEAELKARVTDPEMVLRALAAMAPSTSAIYWDRYFDSEDGSFTASGRELRIRTVDCAEAVRPILTFKAPAVDAESGSKPEYETVVADPEATAAILLALGYRALVSFSKHCANHRIRRANRDMLATVVTVPEIDGTFLEVETLTDDVSDVPAALMAVRAVMVEVGIIPRDFTTELYTDVCCAPGQAAPCEPTSPDQLEEAVPNTSGAEPLAPGWELRSVWCAAPKRLALAEIRATCPSAWPPGRWSLWPAWS